MLGGGGNQSYQEAVRVDPGNLCVMSGVCVLGEG